MIDATQILLRMRSTVGAETERELGRVLGLSHSTVSAWKARNSVPLEYLVRVARDRDVSMDWLVFGIVGERECRGRSYEEATAGAKTSLAQCDAEASADEMRVPYPLALSDDTRRLLAASFRALAVDLERDVPEKLGPAGYAFVKKFLGTEEG